MKISNQNGSKPTGSAGQTSTAKVDGKKGDTSSSGSADKTKGSARVDVSERAQQMQKAKEIAGGDSIDEAKVARLQKMIDEGKYKVDSEAVADRMVDTAMLFPD